MSNLKKMKCRASGGRVVYSGGASNVAKEAKEKKRGGGVDMKVDGSKAKHRIHKARGGGVGSDKHPFSSAHRG